MGNERLDRLVQIEQPLFVEPERRRGDEGLGHARDPESAAGRERFPRGAVGDTGGDLLVDPPTEDMQQVSGYLRIALDVAVDDPLQQRAHRPDLSGAAPGADRRP